MQTDTCTSKSHQMWMELPPYTIKLSQYPRRPGSLPLLEQRPVSGQILLSSHTLTSLLKSAGPFAQKNLIRIEGLAPVRACSTRVLAELGERLSPAEKRPPSSVGCREAASCKFHLGLWALPSGDTNTACLLSCPECGFPALFWITLDPHWSTAMGGLHWNVPQPGWFMAARSLKDVSSSWLIFLSLFSLFLYLNIAYCNILQNYSLESHAG